MVWNRCLGCYRCLVPDYSWAPGQGQPLYVAHAQALALAAALALTLSKAQAKAQDQDQDQAKAPDSGQGSLVSRLGHQLRLRLWLRTRRRHSLKPRFTLRPKS